MNLDCHTHQNGRVVEGQVTGRVVLRSESPNSPAWKARSCSMKCRELPSFFARSTRLWIGTAGPEGSFSRARPKS